MLEKPPKIEDVGLKKYLDEKYQAAGGYAEFEKRINLEEPKSVIAKAFGVNRKTIYRWLQVHEAEATRNA